MHAEHIIGLTAKEKSGDLAATASAVAARFTAIQADGALRPYCAARAIGAHGNTFELDHLAGDSSYIFLSVGERYRRYAENGTAYGFVFDAERLVLERGALVGPDMLQHYEDLMEQCIAEVAATLPPLPMISEEEIAGFAALAGDDPAMLAYVREQSVYRDSDIDMAVRCGDMDEPGAEEAVALFRQRVPALQAQWRKSGAEALAMLGDGMEVLVKGSLPLALSTAIIEGGYENNPD